MIEGTDNYLLAPGNPSCVEQEDAVRRIWLRQHGLCWRAHFHSFISESLIALIGSRQFEGIGDVCLALGYARDDIGAADPMCFGQVGLRPLRGVVGGRVIKTDDVF